MNILVTGGAGYIGSHVVKYLLEEEKYKLTIIDNFSTSSICVIEELKKLGEFDFIQLDINSTDQLEKLFENKKFDAIYHFAASISVEESVNDPLKYYKNNVVNSIKLIELSVKYNVGTFVFSSTATVYDSSKLKKQEGMNENFPQNPINPYGKTKQMVENILQDTARENKEFKYVILRYFNVAGADMYYDKSSTLSPRFGQSNFNVSHLIKIASQCALKKREYMSVYGNDYNTKDGTGVRDYIHVDDLAMAHIKALDYVLKNKKSDIFNIGYSRGYSVLDVITAMKNVSKENFKVNIAEKREGDPAILIADITKAKNLLNWIPKYDNLELICHSALNWEKKTS